MIPQQRLKGPCGLLEVTQKSPFFSQPMMTGKRPSPHRWGPVGGPTLEKWRYHPGSPSLVRGSIQNENWNVTWV